MAIDDVHAVVSAERLNDAAGQERMRELRSMACSNILALTGAELLVYARVKLFVEWLDTPLPPFRTRPGEGDKFAQLVDMSRGSPECMDFYAGEVGVDASTVWRWSKGRSRPSQFVGNTLAREVEARLRDSLWTMISKSGLFEKLQSGAGAS